MKILMEKPLADTGTDVDDSSDFFDGKVTLEIGVDPGQQLFDPGVLKGGRSAVGKHFRLLADEEQHPGNSGADLKLIACLSFSQAEKAASKSRKNAGCSNFK